LPEERSIEEELARARESIAELHALAGAADLLDPALDFPGLALRALELALRVVPADAALLVAQGSDGLRSTYLLRGEGRLRDSHDSGDCPSQLAREVLASGEEGIRRSPDSPGARAMAEVLGAVPAVRVAVPLVRSERVLGVLEVAYRVEPQSRFLERSAALDSVAEHLVIALDHARLVRAHARRARELAHLHDVGRKMSAHRELDDVLEAIVEAVRELIPADAVGIFLIDDETGELRNTTFRGYDASLAEMRVKAGGGIIGWVARTAQGVIVPDVGKDDRYIEVRRTTRSEMAAPIQYENRVIGIFNMESDRENAYSPSQLELLTGFGNQAAVSIVNARLHEEVTEKRLLEQQLEIARGIQTSLLPRSAPAIPGHFLAGRNLPSESVGGDYFDFVPLPGGRWAIIVADVSGHGIPAGLVMAGFRAEVRAGLRHHDEPRAVLAEANRTLCGELAPEFFVTAFLGVYSPPSGTLVYTNAGHEPGLLVRQEGVDLLHEGGLILGAFPEAEFRQATVHVERGSRLLLYTDGLSEGGDPWGGQLGVEGVVRLLREVESAGTPPAEVPARMLDRAEAMAALPPDEADDRTLVLLRRE
jgi:sigma-B regulation protein RsbU (phosphoserine phosphatase)